MSEENTKKSWRTKSEYIARNVRIMSVDEPKELSSELTLCSFSFVDQPGNDKDQDTWVRVTGANQLAERIFNSKPGDRVNVSGKPFFRAYVDKSGEARCQVEIKYPDVDFLDRAVATEVETKVETEVVSEVSQRRPGRPGVKNGQKSKLPY